jgi:hypothetical protein
LELQQVEREYQLTLIAPTNFLRFGRPCIMASGSSSCGSQRIIKSAWSRS